MKNSRQLIFLLIIGIIFVSCARPPITMNSIQSIEREMHYDRFKSQVTRKPTSSFNIQHNGISYFIELYPMQTGIRTYSFYTYTPSGGFVTPTSVPVSEDYVFIFCDDRLMFWGFLNECHKAEHELIQQLAPLIAEQYEKAKAKKKTPAPRGQ